MIVRILYGWAGVVKPLAKEGQGLVFPSILSRKLLGSSSPSGVPNGSSTPPNNNCPSKVMLFAYGRGEITSLFKTRSKNLSLRSRTLHLGAPKSELRYYNHDHQKPHQKMSRGKGKVKEGINRNGMFKFGRLNFVIEIFID